MLKSKKWYAIHTEFKKFDENTGEPSVINRSTVHSSKTPTIYNEIANIYSFEEDKKTVANLIAAAPEMLSALEAAHEELSMSEFKSSQRIAADIISPILLKARGKS